MLRRQFGGRLGGEESVTRYASADLLPAAPPDGTEALVEVSGGLHRLMRYTSGAWTSVPVRWSTPDTGATGYRSLRTAAGAAADDAGAALPGDAAVLDDESGIAPELYAVVSDAGQLFFVPKVLPGGIILGKTHSVTIVGRPLWREDPTALPEYTVALGSGGGLVDYDAGSGRIRVHGGTSGTTTVIDNGTEPLNPDAILVVAYNVSVPVAAAAATSFAVWPEDGADALPVRAYADTTSSVWKLQITGTNPVLTQAIASEADCLLLWRPGAAQFSWFVNWPTSASDTESAAPATRTRGTTLLRLEAGTAATPGQLHLEGLLALELTVIP